MSTSNQATHHDLSASASNLTSIFDSAVDEYKRLTKKDLRTHPVAAILDACKSPDTILDVFRNQAQDFDRFRKGNEKLMEWLNPTVHVLFTLSGTLGEGIGLPFSPAKAIFTGIGVLLGAVKDHVARYDALVNLFERIQLFLQRLKFYVTIPLTTEMIELFGKIMAQVLSILALSTREMKEWRIKRFVKRLMGRTDIEDAFLRFDFLTKEEGLMTAARTLRMVHNVDGTVAMIEEIIRDVDDDVKATKQVISNVDNNVTATNEVITAVETSIKAIKELTSDVGSNMVVIEETTRSIDNNVQATNDSMNELKRNQSREKLRTWLLPPNPSINHNVVYDAYHYGSAMWFIQGSTFGEWKKNGSLLWIRGNPGCGKSVLCSAIIENIKHMQEARSFLFAYYYFDFQDASKRDLRGLLSSLLMQLSECSVVCWEILYQSYTRCDDGSNQPSEAALAACLKDMLESQAQVPIYIIVDALDECPITTGTPSPRKRVLNFVKDLVGRKYSNLHICITSRPEQDIQATLNPLTSPSCQVSLHEEIGQVDDINGYIRFFVHSHEAMRSWRIEDKELVINTLSERAGGMFRWTYCQLDTLCRCFPRSIRGALSELPATLDDTYERTLQGIPKEKREDAVRLFQCLVAAIRPLRVQELAEIFTIEFERKTELNVVEDWRPENPEEAILSACSTLISVIDDQD